MANDLTKMDFFRGKELVADPYPYYEALREQCPVTREEHHGVTMITGWDEPARAERRRDVVFLHLVTGRFPAFRYRSRATTSPT